MTTGVRSFALLNNIAMLDSGIVRYPLVSLSYSFCWFSFWSIVRTYRRACRRHIFLWWHTLDSNSLNQPLPSCLDYLNVLSANSWDMKSSRVYVIMICYPPKISPKERFHSRGQHLCRLMGNKRKRFIKLEKTLTPIGFVWNGKKAVSVSLYGRHDVMWKRSVATVFKQLSKLFVDGVTYRQQE